MKYATAFCAALLVSAPVGSAPKQRSALSAAYVMSRINAEGGHKVARDLWEHEADFGHVMQGIESGNPQWLEVASKLRPHTDAALSLSIDFSVARALPEAPTRVLALIGHGFEFTFICTSPFIEPEPGVAEDYERRTLAALAKVKDPALRALAIKCAEAVRLPAPAKPSARL